MKTRNIPLAERSVELIIGKILRYGLIIACTITCIGGIIYLIQQQGIIPNYASVPSTQTFHGTASYLREVSSIIPRVLQGDGAAIIQLGVALLILTPIARVVFSLLAFLLERDYLYVVITGMVLVVIILSMVLKLH